MTELDTALLGRLVVGHKRDGRCIYDPAAKLSLIEAALRPGVSVAGLALGDGINANLLRTWMRKRQARLDMGNPIGALITAVAPLTAFTPVVPAKPAARAEMPGLASQLPNGARIEVVAVEADGLTVLLQHLHALPCSASARD